MNGQMDLFASYASNATYAAAPYSTMPYTAVSYAEDRTVHEDGSALRRCTAENVDPTSIVHTKQDRVCGDTEELSSSLPNNVVLFPGVDAVSDIGTMNDMPKAKHGGYRANYRKGGTQTVYPIKKMEELEHVALWLYENKDHKYLLGFILGINLGLRANELLKLRMPDVFLPDGTIRYIEDTQNTNDRISISQSKTHGKIRTVYLNEACVAALRWYFSNHPTVISKNHYIFSSREGGTIEVDTFRKVLKEACEAAGIRQNVGTHTMRKTWGWWQYTTNTGKQYGDVAQLQRLYGHESPMTTLRYIGVMDEEDKALYHAMVLAVASDVIGYPGIQK